VKFTHATHVIDVDGVQVTIGVTRHGEIRMLTASGNTDVARLTPELAGRLAEILRECARHARGHCWAPLRGSEVCPRCGAAPGELHREDCGSADQLGAMKIELNLTRSEAATLLVATEREATHLPEDSQLRLEMELLARRIDHAVNIAIERKHGFVGDASDGNVS
jgi:hypothetical protein